MELYLSSMPSDEMPLDRRTVLKSIGATAALGTGFASTTGSAAATDPKKRRLADEYRDGQNLISAFERHGGDLRATLVAEGFVGEDFSFQSLDIELDSEVNEVEPTDHDTLTGVTAITEEGTTTAFASVSASSETHELALFVQPERDKAYALVEPKSGGDRLLVSESDVSPTGCIRESCSDQTCDTCYNLAKTYECDSYCENCELTGTSCECYFCGP